MIDKVRDSSIIREHEYKRLSALTLNGKILDVGGSKRSGYHDLIQGVHEYVVINIDAVCEPDVFVDIEKSFPFEAESFDSAICLNVLEHIFNFENVIKETVRTLRTGGTFVLAVPMLHHIHGSPDDYFRYTESALRRLVAKYGCEVVEIHTLGGGFFSLGYQSVGRELPTRFLRFCFKRLASFLDESLCRLSKKYRKLTDRLPLGYLVISRKVSLTCK